MLGKLLRKIRVFDVTGAEMDASVAVTYLSEILLVPACALRSYISWESIDQKHAKANLNYKGVTVEGVFTFNDKGEFTKFETDDRYMDTGKGMSEKHRWTAEVSNYIEQNGIKRPSRLKAIWNLPDGDYEYFAGVLTDVVYNSAQILKK